MKSSACLMFLAAALLSSPAQAAIVGPTYPPPGGVTFSSSGTGLGFAGGKTFSYSGFDSSAYSNLYWGLANPTLNDGNISLQDETLSSLNSTTAFLTGQTLFDVPYGSGVVNLNTETIVTITSGGTFQNAASVGVTGSEGFVTHVTGNSFTVNIQMLTFWGGQAPSGFNNPSPGWYATNDLYNMLNTRGDGTTTSITGGFWSEAPVATVPEPSSLALFGMGALGLAFYRRRRSI